MDATAVLDLLVRRRASLATAESVTGGRLAARISAVPGASHAYVGGVVAYATEVKRELLGVPGSLLEQHGVVSAACAQAMAVGVQSLLGSTYALATTGVAGPDRQEEQPVGTVFIGVAGPGGASVVSLELSGDRHAIQDRACEEALAALGGILRGEEPALR